LKRKYLIIVNLRNSFGGAEIRYLNLFKEISVRSSDYFLIINRKLFELACSAGYISKADNKIIILEIDKRPTALSAEVTNAVKTFVKHKNYFRKIRKIRNSLISIFELIYFIYKLHKIFIQEKPDYVYSVWVGGMIVWPLKYIHKFKLVYSYMDSGYSSLECFFWHSLKSERKPLIHADTVDFLSNELYNGVKIRVPLNKKTKIAVTPCSFKNYDNLYPIYPKKNTIVFCSRMAKIKNPLLLLKSIMLFNIEYPKWADITFQFLGDGECLNEMKEFVYDNNLSNVVLLGNIQNPELYFQKSKIFISIQQSNNYPSQSLLEAMACGNAIIASDVGETRKLVTENEGFLVPLNEKLIVEAMINLILNENKCTQCGENARQKVIMEHTIENYLEYFHSLETL